MCVCSDMVYLMHSELHQCYLRESVWWSSLGALCSVPRARLMPSMHVHSNLQQMVVVFACAAVSTRLLQQPLALV